MMLACWVEDPTGEAFKKHLPRLDDYIWLGEDGIKMQSFGSQSWDCSLATQALLAGNLHNEYGFVLKKAHNFLKISQVTYLRKRILQFNQWCVTNITIIKPLYM